MGISPQFDEKYPQIGDIFPMFLTSKDLPELCAHFKEITSQPGGVTAKVCEIILEFTAGHFFPFVTIVAHLLDPETKIDMINILDDLGHLCIDYYLASKEFRYSAAYAALEKGTREEMLSILVRCGHRNSREDDVEENLFW